MAVYRGEMIFNLGRSPLWFNTPPLGAAAGDAGDMSPRIRKDFKEKSPHYRRTCPAVVYFFNVTPLHSRADVAIAPASLFARDIISCVSNVAGSLIPATAIVMAPGKIRKRAAWRGGMDRIFCGATFGVPRLFVRPFQKAAAGVFAGSRLLESVAASKTTAPEAETVRLGAEYRGRTK
ncbi:MAG: hypothetical protein LBD58_12475 [Treponema sp.]|jgi:hypothetical protein|nr:hypothetical protein [Treponema sp.]